MNFEIRRLKRDLDGILRSYRDGEIVTLIETLCGFADKIGLEASESLIGAFPELFAYQPILMKAFRETIAAREIAESSHLLQRDLSGTRSFRQVAGSYSASLYDRLTDIAGRVDFNTCRRLVMVGCGWRPVTMFHLHDTTDVPEIVGLDVRREAVDTANALAAKLGYQRSRAEVGDGARYDYRDAQIVYVASMVSPKPTIVSRIAETAPDDVQIVLWEPHSFGRLWMESAEEGLDPRLEITGRGPVSWLSRDIFARRRPSGMSP